MEQTKPRLEVQRHLTSNPQQPPEELGSLKAKSRPTCWRHKNKTRLFLISCLGRGKGGFREDPGLPFHHAKPILPKDGPGSRAVRTASILSLCLAPNTRSWAQGRIWTCIGECHRPSGLAHLPAGQYTDRSEKGQPSSTKAHVFLAVH